jgi:hypothetical protein
MEKLDSGLQSNTIESDSVKMLKNNSLDRIETQNFFQIYRYSDADAASWDEMIANCPMATFLQTRRYLSYHADRFQDVSLIIKDGKNRILGLFPAALDPANPLAVVSHPGITYGGIIHPGSLNGENMSIALESIRDYYAALGMETLRYKLVPNIYHQSPAADDSYALFRLGATRYRCDLACAIDLAKPAQPSQRRQRGLRKAVKNGVQVKFGVEFAERLWSVLEDNLASKHGAKPVHSVREIRLLHSLFPENIEFAVALAESQVVAGIVLFSTPQVSHSQYIAASSAGYKLSALDAVFETCIQKAKSEHKHYFSFGTSNENEGKYLNTGLYQFKSEFGGGGIVHEFYEINLRR